VGETRLITSIDVTAGRRIRVIGATWEEYWGQCGPFTREIAQLKAAWTALIAGNFASSLRPELVRAYFRLLRICLDGHACGHFRPACCRANGRSLRTLLAKVPENACRTRLFKQLRQASKAAEIPVNPRK